MNDKDKAIEMIRSAIINEGPVPQYHRHVMRKHRQEWPTLWKGIDALLASHYENTKGEEK